MSSTNTTYSPYCAVRLLPATYNGVNEIVAKLKCKRKRWSVSAVVNLALVEFLEKLPKLSDRQLENLIDNYEQLKKAET